jgi:hypothetical protein
MLRAFAMKSSLAKERPVVNIDFFEIEMTINEIKKGVPAGMPERPPTRG